jgi:hypothetical protein
LVESEGAVAVMRAFRTVFSELLEGDTGGELKGLTMIVEFQELTAVCSYSVTFLRASSQACER